ncbi:MAG: UDP-N-acetylmuramate dehydrogenase [Parcubacteria group bacterium Gr01-1014_30]|nr:MAG: UDP-N-acetylmuramate dehydrogenase [Parcubacteria group bacterium Gr01-1014_30]
MVIQLSEDEANFRLRKWYNHVPCKDWCGASGETCGFLGREFPLRGKLSRPDRPPSDMALLFKKKVLLKNHTTFRIGGPAKCFYEAKTAKHLIAALRKARELKLPFFVLGEGSNLLVSDKGFNGLVVKIQDSRFKIQDSYLWAASGVSLSTLVRETGKRGLSGLEWAGGLPGTFGGAVFGNAGAFGGETKDNIIWVEALDPHTNFGMGASKNLKVKRFTKAQCKFGYRTSIFKERGWLVLSALLSLKRGDKKAIQGVALAHIKQRKERGPLEYPNAGSIFKNCKVTGVPKKVAGMFKGVIKEDPFPVIPTAAIIAKTPGLMGIKIGGAQVSKKHPNFIINTGGAKAIDVLSLINLVKRKVKKSFGVDIAEEIRYIE